MPVLELSPQSGLYYEHHAPADAGRATFVFFNALTGDTAAWEAVICPVLRDAGHGTLVYNMQGQADSQAIGLVLINTLRREGPRLKWIGDALVRAVEVGGLPLFRDLFLPLLMNEDWLYQP
jgi:hypothetical protein